MSRFKVLAGKHVEGGRIYSRGDIVDSASDLSKLNHPGATKFEKLDDHRPRRDPPHEATSEGTPFKTPGGQTTTGVQGEYEPSGGQLTPRAASEKAAAEAIAAAEIRSKQQNRPKNDAKPHDAAKQDEKK